jgi:hypothetical protein
MPELGTYGSVRGAAGNSRPYRECRPNDEPSTRIEGPASESRQGRKAREVGHPAQRVLWGFGGQMRRSECRSMRPARWRAGLLQAKSGPSKGSGEGRGLLTGRRRMDRPCTIVAGGQPAERAIGTGGRDARDRPHDVSILIAVAGALGR